MLRGDYAGEVVHECSAARARLEKMLRERGHPAPCILDEVVHIPEYDDMRNLWYLDGGECLHWIQYCPFCGADLFEESTED